MSKTRRLQDRIKRPPSVPAFDLLGAGGGGGGGGGGGSGVTSFNSRTGAVVPVSGDYGVGQVAGAAPLSDPSFTGTPSSPAAPVAPEDLVNKQYADAGVRSFNGRTGNVTPQAGDYSFSQLSGAPFVPIFSQIGITTASLVPDASELGTIAAPKLSFGVLVTGNRPAWVRFYATAAERTLDAARDIDVDPTTPVLLEVILAVGLLNVPLAPLLGLVNRDDPVAGSLYYNITNLDTSQGTVAVTTSVFALQ